MSLRRLAVPALAVVALIVGACMAPIVPPPTPAPVTPPTVNPGIDAARAAVAGALQRAGFALETPIGGYDPGQPGQLQTTPHASYRVNLVDRSQGWVVIYDLGSNDAAIDAAEVFAAYLRALGRSNYPGDARFTLNVVDRALIFHWWAESRSTEPDRARLAFEAIAGVGQQVDLVF